MRHAGLGLAWCCLAACGGGGGEPVDAIRAIDAAADATTCVSAGWTTELATTDGNVHLEGSMAVDATGGVHASCTLFSNGVSYLRRGDGSWAIEPAPFIGAPNYNALALAPDGGIHIAYRDASAATLSIRYAERSPGGTWTAGVIHGGDNPTTPSIVADATGRVHVAYTPAASTVTYKYRDPPGSWSAPESFDPASYPNSLTFAVEASGAAHAGYTDAFTLRVMYASRPVAGTWSFGMIDTGVGAAREAPRSLIVDDAGVVHYAYPTDAGLIYARRTNGRWTMEVADATAGRGRGAAIARDPSGRIAIAYKHSADPGVWIAHRAATGTWLVTQLDPTAVYLGPASVAVDRDYGIHVLWKSADSNLTYGTARICPD